MATLRSPDEQPLPLGEPHGLQPSSGDYKEANEALLLVSLRERTLAEEAKRSAAEVQELLERERFLAKASALLGSSLHFDTSLQTVVQLAVPKFADLCSVDLVCPQRLERVATAVSSDTRSASPRALEARS